MIGRIDSIQKNAGSLVGSAKDSVLPYGVQTKFNGTFTNYILKKNKLYNCYCISTNKTAK